MAGLDRIRPGSIIHAVAYKVRLRIKKAVVCPTRLILLVLLLDIQSHGVTGSVYRPFSFQWPRVINVKPNVSYSLGRQGSQEPHRVHANKCRSV